MSIPTDEQLIEALGGILPWAGQCHAASIKLVKSGLLPTGSRVARGSARGVTGQHSWVVVNSLRRPRVDVYEDNQVIIDPTLWSYDKSVEGIFRDVTGSRRYHAHGAGSIWEYGRPAPGNGEIIEFDGWSPAAKRFLEACGPLDLKGWHDLVHFPMEDWPSSEIIERLSQDKRISPFIPVDILGHVTDLNPEGLYLA